MPATKCSATDAELAAMYRSGMTLAEIGALYGITRERVRQRLDRSGVTRFDGGSHVTTAKRTAMRSALKDLRCLKRYGCTHAHYLSILNGPRSGAGVRPTQAYSSQKGNAEARRIRWNLTLAEWWAIWQASGKWSERGRGQGYAMCRKSDAGAYEIGNVYIGGRGDNAREYQARRRGKPFIPVSELFVTA
jgi:hypothetical protein